MFTPQFWAFIALIFVLFLLVGVHEMSYQEESGIEEITGMSEDRTGHLVNACKKALKTPEQDIGIVLACRRVVIHEEIKDN